MSKTFRRNLNIIIKRAPLKIANDLSIPPLTLLLFSLIPKDNRIQWLDTMRSDLRNGNGMMWPLELYLNFKMITLIRSELSDDIAQLTEMLTLTDRELIDSINHTLAFG